MNKTKICALLCAMLCASALRGECKIPRSAAEDTEKIMSQKYWDAWNDAAQKKIDADIEANRKADFTFAVGKIAEGTKVSVEQISHEFKFGAHIFNYGQLGDPALDAKYKSLYGTLFNSATVAFYWCKFEMQPNRPRFKSEFWDSPEFWNNCKEPKSQIHWRRPPTDEVIAYLKSRGVRVHGHAIVWGSRAYSIPPWLFDQCLEPSERAAFDSIIKEKMKDGIKCADEKYTKAFAKLTAKDLDAMLPRFGENFAAAHDKRIRELAAHYGDTVDSWDVVNESVPDSIGDTMNEGGKLMKSQRYKIMPADYTYKAFKTATEAFPKSVKLNINDSPYRCEEHYAPQILGLKKRGVRVDIVGVQMHIFKPKYIGAIADGTTIDERQFKIDEKKIYPQPVWDFFKVIDTGTPVHMSEITISAPDNTERGKMVQAIMTRNMYRLWFSLKPVMGITWWNVVDDCGALGEPSISGLFTRAMNPKPAYYAVEDLINRQWRTNLELSPDESGKIKFRGFRGKYRLSWTDASGAEKFAIVEVK